MILEVLVAADLQVVRQDPASHRPACYFVTVALRNVLLAAGAVLVLGVAVYLFFEVRAEPVRGEARGANEQGIGADEPGRAQDEPRPARATQARTAPVGEAGGPLRSFGPVRREPPRGPDGEPQDVAPHKLDAVMAEANKAYDRGDLDEAKAIARKVLRTSPNNVRMLRIVVSASCIVGETAEAQAAYVLLPEQDREQMKTRCARYGASFTDP